MASLAGRTEASDHMHAICRCDVRRLRDYNFDQSAKSPLSVRAACEEQPQAPPIDSISPTSFWLHLLSPLSFLPLSLAALHPNLYSFLPLLIHPFHLFFFSLPTLLPCSFSTKIITLEGTSISATYSLLSFIFPVLSSGLSRNWPRRCYFRLHSC